METFGLFLMKEEIIAGLKVVKIDGDPSADTIILLHGFGANNRDLVGLSKIYNENPKPTWIFPQGPLKIQFSKDFVGHAWFDVDMALLRSVEDMNNDELGEAFSKELEISRKPVELLIKELSIPRSKLVLGGFSQGAVLAIDTMLHCSEQIKALLIFSGTLVYENYWRQLLPVHKKTPFFQSHGRADPILPVQRAEKLEKLLLSEGLDGKLHLFNGGHTIPIELYGKIYDFLKSHLPK